jgi:hypothetical protein
MNPLIVTIVIALGTFILAIFGAGWLNQQAMKNFIDAKFEGLEGRFKGIDAQFKALDARFDAVDQRFAALESRIDRIERQLDQIFKPTLPRA